MNFCVDLMNSLINRLLEFKSNNYEINVKKEKIDINSFLVEIEKYY